MLASTYLGGYDNDAVVEGSSINLDSSGNIYVIGQTQSSNFPTTSGVYDTSYNGSYDTFIAKLDSSLSATPSDTTAPIGSISINSGALYTNSTTVTLNLFGNGYHRGDRILSFRQFNHTLLICLRLDVGNLYDKLFRERFIYPQQRRRQ